MTTVANWTVNEMLARYPATMPVFNALGVDTCCGSEVPLRDAATFAGVDWSALVRALEDATGGSFDASPECAR